MQTLSRLYVRIALMSVLLWSVAGVAADAASSQESGKRLAVYVGGGMSDPNGDLAAGAEVGFYGMSRLSYKIVPRVEAMLGVDYHSFNLDVLKIPGITGGRFWALLLNGGIKVDPGKPGSEVSPFLIASGGIAKIDFTDTLKSITGLGTIVADSDIKPFVEFGGGFEFNQVFVIVKFVNVFLNDSDARFVSFGLGIKLNLM